MLTPLVTHSAYSLLWGVLTPRQLVEAAVSAGWNALALTDCNGMYGLPAFVDACRGKNLRPIVGVEFAGGWGRVVAIARTKEGFSRLTRLLSARAAILNEAGLPVYTRLRALERGSPPQSEAVAKADTFLMSELSAMASMSDSGLFLLSDSPAFLNSAPCSPWLFALLSTAHRSRWRSLLKTGHKPVLSPEITFLEPDQREVQRLLVAIGLGVTVREVPDSMLAPETAAFEYAQAATSGEKAGLGPEAGSSGSAGFSVGANFELRMCDVEHSLAEAAAANRRITEEALSEPFGEFVFPKWHAHAAGGGGPGTGAPNNDTAACPSAPAMLRRLAYEGAVRRYGSLSLTVRNRLEYELGIIEEKGFCDYFLVVNEIIKKAQRICGRGSAAASIVSYALGITDVDPIAHNLFFDRFLNPGRKDPPDIDVDFAWDERDSVLEATMQLFGAEHCARVANHNCFRFRGALRDTARAFGMPDEETSVMERRIEHDREAALAGADPVWKDIVSLAMRITGLPRNLGTHSGGIIIVPGNIADHVPVERTGSGILVTAWDKDGVEDAGLVKIDLLGNRSLAVVRDAIQNLHENGTVLNLVYWHPEQDPDTIAMIARGDTMGVFYVESPAMRLLQKKTGVGDFAHLVIHSSIIRPAANRYIEEYIERLKGKPWKPLHPVLAELFSETYGIMCYQEDVSKVAVALAGFSSSDADAIRKVLTKKDRGHRLEMWKQRFYEGATERGAAPDVIDAIWDMILSFSGYSFVKAHSASYAMLSFQSAWLRAHYPAEFMAAVLSNHGGFYSTLAYASEARRMGLELLPPDVNESALRCKGRGRTIRWGLGMIAGLSENTLKSILEARGGDRPVAAMQTHSPAPDITPAQASRLPRFRPFLSVEDFAGRVRFSREEAEALVGSGALDSIAQGRGRPALLMTLLKACTARAARTGPELFESAAETGGLYGSAPSALHQMRGTAVQSSIPASAPPPGPKTSERRIALSQMQWLGTTLSCHPLSLVPGALQIPRLRAAVLDRHIGEHVRLVGWLITAKEVLTMHEEPMEFLTFEDETTSFETVLFPAAYRQFRPALLEGGAFVVDGRVEESHGAITVTIAALRRLPAIPKLAETPKAPPPSGFGYADSFGFQTAGRN